MKNNILIVDDSKTILNGLKNTIESRLNITVHTAASMKECAEVLLKQKGKFTLALLDLGLPDAPNGEIVDFIKKFKIPSIVLTGTKLEEDNAIFKNSNLIDYIIKNGSYAIEYTVSVVNRFLLNANVEVLIIDDSKTFAAKMQALCMKYNLKTIVNYSAKEGLQTIKERPNIKLILLDYMMPEMDGLEFTKELRKSYKKDEIAIIALSGMSEKNIVASFLKFGANDFIYKDFSNEEFFARVNNNLEVLELFTSTQDKAKKDFLTGAFNKNYLLNIGQEICQSAKKKKSLIAIVLIDIDKFQTINESYGHEIGDEVIIVLSKLLLEKLNKDSIVARLNADQFCVLIKNRPYTEIHQIFTDLKEVAKEERIDIHNGNIEFTVSIGATVTASDNIEDMIDTADESLANAKHKGGDMIIID